MAEVRFARKWGLGTWQGTGAGLAGAGARTQVAIAGVGEGMQGQVGIEARY